MGIRVSSLFGLFSRDSEFVARTVLFPSRAAPPLRLDDITLHGQALLPRHISLECVFPLASLGDKQLKPEALIHLI